MTIRAAIACGLLSGALLALSDTVFALSGHRSLLGSLEGVATIVAVDVAAGLVLGALQAGVLLALGDRQAIGDALHLVASVVARLLRPPAPGPARSRQAVGALASILFLVAGFAGLSFIALMALDEPRLTTTVVVRYSIAAAMWLVVLGFGLMALRRPASLLAARLVPRLAGRGVIAAALGVFAAVAILRRNELLAFMRAVDVRPTVLLTAFIATDLVLLVVATTNRRLHRWATRLTNRRGVAACLLVLAASWAIALLPASRSADAQRIYRKDAPVARLFVGQLSRLLDFDGDGYSAFFGDGDCAPFDARRSPGVLETPENGVDDDCFDGDLKGASAVTIPPPGPVPNTVPANISFVLILIDSLRADHLGAYGYHRDTSPNIDEFARAAVVYERAYAPSSYTYASVPSILTGQYPGMLPDGIMRKRGTIGRDEPTIAKVLREEGYATAIVTDGSVVLNDMGLGVGFTVNTVLHDDAREVTDLSLRFIEENVDRPFLLVVHYIGPHSPYRTHEDGRTFGGEFVDLYDHEIAHVDLHVGRLLSRLGQPDMAGNVAVFITSDHGEAFGEHGTYYHGHNLYEENIRVPLVIAAPGAQIGRRDGSVVSLVDIFPTVLHLARLPIPMRVRGHAQTKHIFTAEPLPPRYVFAESHFVGYDTDQGYQAAVVGPRYKLIQDAETRTYLLFDLDEDPDERHDLYGHGSELALELRRALVRFRLERRAQ